MLQSNHPKIGENKFLFFSCLCLGLNLGPFSPESSALPSEPSHLGGSKFFISLPGEMKIFDLNLMQCPSAIKSL